MITYGSYGNIPFVCNNLLPGMITNFGGDTQVTTIDPDLFSGNRLNITFNALAQQMMASSVMTTNPMMTQVPCIPAGAVQGYLDMIAAPVTQNIINSKLTSSVNGIQVTKMKLESMLTKEDITDEEKEKINELLEKLKEQEEKIKEVAQETNLDEKLKKANEIEDEVRKIANEVTKLSKPSTDKTDETDKTEETDNTNKTDKTEETEETDNTNKTDNKKQTERQGSSSNIQRSARAIADLFHEAVNSMWGTDNDKFNEACDNLDENHIISVMKAYKDSYGTSFMKDFMEDAGYNQKRDYGKAIMRTLREKAIDLGIMDDCKEDFAAINKQMDRWFWINNNIAQNYDNIIAKIAEAEGTEYSV